MMTMLDPKAEMEEMGPYSSLCFAQCSQSYSFGKSNKFPIKGKRLGPGGRGRRRAETQRISNASVSAAANTLVTVKRAITREKQQEEAYS